MNQLTESMQTRRDSTGRSRFKVPRGMPPAPVLIIGNSLVATTVTQLWRPGPHVVARRLVAFLVAALWFSIIVLRPVFLNLKGTEAAVRSHEPATEEKKVSEQATPLAVS